MRAMTDDQQRRWREAYEKAKLRDEVDFDTLSSEPLEPLADMQILFEGIDLAGITTSMTISGPAPMLFAMYIAAAEEQGPDVSKLDGTCQTDILKEYIAQKEWLFPPEPHLRLTADMMG